jgi:hypothetical protein
MPALQEEGAAMAIRKSGRGSIFSVAFFAVLCAAFVVVFTQGYVGAWTCAGTADQCAQYLAAVNDAKDNMTIDRVWNKLTPIVTENPNLIWKDGVVGTKVLVVAYKYGTTSNPPFSTCQPGVAFPKDCALSGSAWVTVAPEALNFFSKNTFSTLRIEQLLGLPPNYGNNYIVEYWADPSDLFRPASDPQINYQEGTIKFPWDSSRQLALNTGGDYKVWDDYCPISTDPACACAADAQYMDYKCWFQNRRAWVYSYDLPSAPYPWTGLGYTYDWGNSKTPVGMSEFVLNKAPVYSPFTVTIQSVTVAADYFARGQKSKLTVAKDGFGKGSVTSSPAGLNCGSGCLSSSKSFNKYSEVTLTAKAAKGSYFTGWGGACSGALATCTIPMVSDLSVTASFFLPGSY